MDTFDLDDVEIDLLRLRSPQSFEDMFKMWIQNDGYNKCTGHKKVHPRLPGTWDKALDFYRFAKSAKIRLRLIFSLVIHSLERI